LASRSQWRTTDKVRHKRQILIRVVLPLCIGFAHRIQILLLDTALFLACTEEGFIDAHLLSVLSLSNVAEDSGSGKLLLQVVKTRSLLSVELLLGVFKRGLGARRFDTCEAILKIALRFRLQKCLTRTAKTAYLSGDRSKPG